MRWAIRTLPPPEIANTPEGFARPPPIDVTSVNKSTVSTSGTSVTGFVQNKNVDDTFTNLNYVMP